MAKIPKEVQDKLIKALRSEGCLITITEKREGKLNHFQYHRTFPRGDFKIAIDGITALLTHYFPDNKENIESTVKDYG